MYQWATAWLNSNNPKATADLDRLEADSKLFRSLAVLLLIAVPVLIAAPVLFPPAVDHRLALLVLSKRLRITGEVRKQDAKSRCGGEFGLLFCGLLLVGGLHSDEERAPFDMPA